VAETRNAFRTLVKEAPEKLQLRIQQLLDSLVFKDELSATKTEITGSTDFTGTYVRVSSADTITAQHTFAPAAATAPFLLGNNAKTQLVSGLNADYLDSQHGSYYQNASNINAGTLAVSYGGTGLNTLATGRIPYGAGTSAFGSAATFVYSSSSLGVGTAGPDRTLDVLHASDPQIRLTQADGTVYVDLKADSSGNLNVLPSGTTVTLGGGTAGVDYILQFNGETNDGVITWMEDEDYFKFSDGILMDSTEQIFFRDSALYIFSQADGYLNIVSDTGTRLGDATPTNYTQFDSTGHQTMVGTAKPWEDLRIEPVARTTGNNAPTFEKWYDDSANTSRGVYLYSFDDAAAATEKEIFFTMQMPHAWDGGPISVHVHWVGAVADTTAAPRWGLEYVWKDIGEVFGDSVIVYSDGNNYVPGGTEADITANKHYLSEFADITPGTTADGLSSILIGRLFRNSSDAGDTYDAVGAKCGLLYIDAHYQLNSLGSTDEYTK